MAFGLYTCFTTRFLFTQCEQISSSSRSWELRNGVSMIATLHLRGLHLRLGTYLFAQCLNLAPCSCSHVKKNIGETELIGENSMRANR